MGIREGEITFKLRTPLKYKFDGGTHEADHVVLREPGMEHQKFYLRLKQMIMKASLEMSDRVTDLQESVGTVVKPFKDQVDELEEQAEDVYQMYLVAIQCSDKVDAFQFQQTFEKMCCTIARKGLCMIDGKLSMTGSIWLNLHNDDAFEMAVRWCAFFAMPSIEGEKNTSEPQPESHTERMEA